MGVIVEGLPDLTEVGDFDQSPPDSGQTESESSGNAFVAVSPPNCIEFNGAESDEEKLDRLLELATELEHPGIDPQGIATMKEFIESGKFDHNHYIRMWSKRLEDMGVQIRVGSSRLQAAQGSVQVNTDVADVPTSPAGERPTNVWRDPSQTPMRAEAQKLSDELENVLRAMDKRD